jgi:hypothetical protein
MTTHTQAPKKSTPNAPMIACTFGNKPYPYGRKATRVR